jgi:hypothetical protein
MAAESFDLGAPLSETARAGMALLEEAVLAELARFDISVPPRPTPANADIWWERRPVKT